MKSRISEIIESGSPPGFSGAAKDPNGVHVAVPRALKEMAATKWRNSSKKEIANSMGFNSFETVKRSWNDLL